ncbi:hypothetical protein AOE01nite_11040 [Acetobacter oeni]|uniref:Uncharacterized protein n=1 Tax=Acetobacter oeni TaxID=304077 RepID=A0A511XIW3_9PROT|nr:hypothetical protein [Acetobacter oeni]GEN62880.1 hypothetical protein AOE01nite_11040 [Acetobacter oeni]
MFFLLMSGWRVPDRVIFVGRGGAGPVYLYLKQTGPLFGTCTESEVQNCFAIRKPG